MDKKVKIKIFLFILWVIGQTNGNLFKTINFYIGTTYGQIYEHNQQMRGH